jgi:hypothetical protein
MTTWTSEELARVGTAEELEIASSDPTAPWAGRGRSGSSPTATASTSGP